MHKLTMYENLRDMLETELKDIENKGELKTKETVEIVHHLVSSIEKTNEIIECYEKWENGDEGYSNKRNALGQYSRNSYRMPRMVHYNDYSRDASKQKMVQKLSTLMDDTMSEHEREAIQDCIIRINMS